MTQVMLKSHVSGGCWCQCPAGLAPHLPAVDSDLLFETPDRRFPTSSFQYVGTDAADRGQAEWPVVLLQVDLALWHPALASPCPAQAC